MPNRMDAGTTTSLPIDLAYGNWVRPPCTNHRLGGAHPASPTWIGRKTTGTYAPDSQLMQQGLTHTLSTLPATKARWPVLLRRNFPEPPSPTLITDAALPVTAVTTSEASNSFEPVAHTPWPGLLTEPESEIEPGAFLPSRSSHRWQARCPVHSPSQTGCCTP